MTFQTCTKPGFVCHKTPKLDFGVSKKCLLERGIHHKNNVSVFFFHMRYRCLLEVFHMITTVYVRAGIHTNSRQVVQDDYKDL